MAKVQSSTFLQKSHRFGGIVVLASLLAGCGSPEAAAPAGHWATAYFDVKGLLDQQVKLLSKENLPVEKRAELRDGSVETVRVAKVKWADELQIFYQADINKAALRGAYQLDSTTSADGITRRRYTLRGEHPNASVKELVVIGSGTRVQGLEARIEQHNTLFDTRKHLQLKLQTGRLSSYGVQGSQKLILFDSLHYAVSGRLEVKR